MLPRLSKQRCRNIRFKCYGFNAGGDRAIEAIQFVNQKAVAYD